MSIRVRAAEPVSETTRSVITGRPAPASTRMYRNGRWNCWTETYRGRVCADEPFAAHPEKAGPLRRFRADERAARGLWR